MLTTGSDRPSLRAALGRRVLVADGAMGTMLQRHDLGSTDFGGAEGCSEILNLTRPDVVTSIHQAFLAAGADVVETNTFGANPTALAEYGLVDRLEEMAEAGARIARQAADQATAFDRPRWVLGSIGPGTKLPSLGQTTYETLRAGSLAQVLAMIRGGVDAIQIETAQDLLALRAVVAGVRQALAQAEVDLPIFVSVTVETTGAMLVGSDLGAVVSSLIPLGVDMIGLNCATGPDEMRVHLRELGQITSTALSCMPNAGLPVLGEDGAIYPLTPRDFAQAMTAFVDAYGLSLVGGCCGTTPDHIAALVASLGSDRQVGPRPALSSSDADDAVVAAPAVGLGHGHVASSYGATALTQDVSYLSIGERANAAGSKLFREAMLSADWDSCVQIARTQVTQGAHVIDLCVDYVGRDGRADMTQLAARISREVDVPLQLDSSDPAVIRAGLEVTPGRAIVNSVNFESGDGPDSKFAATMALVRQHGSAVVGLCIDESGQAREVDHKVALARRLISTLTVDYGMDQADIIIDCLTFPIGTGQADTRHDAVSTIEAIRIIHAEYPRVHTVLGVSNVSFGLKPAARVVLNSVFLHECRQAGLDCAIVHPSKILPLAAIPADQVAAALDLVWDRAGDDGLERYLALFEGPAAVEVEASEQAPAPERLRRHVINGTGVGLVEDIDQALADKSALDLINQDLLGAMREVGERFGAGTMQLPFVLKSAEIMKRAVTLLEPHLDRSDDVSRGTIVLATVRGDVHDIGKNLVDIILSNNGYRVVNLGIKQPIADIISAAEQVGADAIGLSGLLVKSTQVMREDLEELNQRGLAHKYPVILGGAALTRGYVDSELQAVYEGEVRYAHDAFEGLSLMEQVMTWRRSGDAPRPAPTRPQATDTSARADRTRSRVTRPVPGGVEVPQPPFFGPRQASATLDEVQPWLDQRALFTARWGLKASPDEGLAELIERAGRPRLEFWLDQIRASVLTDFRVVWGYWPCYSSGDDLVVLAPDAVGDPVRFSFPRQTPGERLCLADYFRDQGEAEKHGPDVVAFQLVTAGSRLSVRTAELFAADAYRDYFELHGLSVQLAEACAELWHARVRRELGLADTTGDKVSMMTRQEYPGERFSFGYPACPDLSLRRPLVELLRADAIGVHLSEGYQLDPEQSTDALIVHHPQAHYFSVR
ncbi:MAG: methionine synthase [Propionibacteriaceae bacterium]|jgi:5-methyltetrahydrofolate--homocysteine methyltransferase|nr:methionine synthase [Propionibacteriaceae bacterium]